MNGLSAGNIARRARPAATRRRRGQLSAASAADSVASDAADFDADERQVRISKFAILHNTNLSGGDWAVDELQEYLERKLWTIDVLERLIPLRSDDPRHLLSIEILAPAIEIGDRQRRVHAHWVLRIRHADRVVMGRLQPALQRHFREESVFSSGFVSVRLLDSAAENYALKEQLVAV